VRGQSVRLAFEAPRSIPIARSEVSNDREST
jgi:sRNA-binding carbon storage regulator CsrA